MHRISIRRVIKDTFSRPFQGREQWFLTCSSKITRAFHYTHIPIKLDLLNCAIKQILPTFNLYNKSKQCNMRKILAFSITLLFTFVSIQSCKQKSNPSDHESNTSELEAPKAKETPGFVHAVYFWLKKDNPELLKEFIEEGLPRLAEVPSIQSVAWGPPAGTPREVVDNSYDLAWIVNFATAEDQDAYQVDSLHKVFVKKYESLFEKVQIYDNTVSGYSLH